MLNNKLFKLLLLLSIILWYSLGYSQKGNLSGKTKDKFQKDLARAESIKFNNAKDYWEKDQNLGNAVREFKEYIELYRDGLYIFQSYLYLGRLYRIQGEYIKAIELYENFFHRYPNKREGIKGKLESCRLYGLVGQGEKAKYCLEVIIRNYPQYTDLKRQAKMELFFLKERGMEPEK